MTFQQNDKHEAWFAVDPFKVKDSQDEDWWKAGEYELYGLTEDNSEFTS